MSRADSNRANQPQEQPKRPPPTFTNWGQASPHQVQTFKDSENVSPWPKGDTLLESREREEMKNKLDDAAEAAEGSLQSDMPPQPRPSEPVRPADLPESAPGKATQSAVNSVTPELLTELRKIIREEFEQLSKGTTRETKDTPQPPPAARKRPSSPFKPFVNAAGVFISSYPPKDAEEMRTATPSSNDGQQKGSPKQSTVRFSDETKPAVPDTSRPEESRRSPGSATQELTTIDRRWGVLFDKDGSPTKRMEHVAWGLANYIVEEFMPQKSIVITPEKMAAFYTHHRPSKEPFPLATLFGLRRSKGFNEALASLYEDLGCQYFLVPADSRSRPTIPGLTPQGFMQWLVAMIQAYPDEEAKRLDKIVSALPIEADSLLDGKPERLPKQISRYLLPRQALRKAKRLVDDAMNDFEEDIQSANASQAKGGSNGTGRPTPIIVTGTSDKRAPASAAGTSSSRYAPDPTMKEAQGADGSIDGMYRDRRMLTASAGRGDVRDPDDRNRRHSMPPPPTPHKTARPGSVDINGRSTPIREAWGALASGGPPGRAPSSASARKNRSPTRNPHSQSVPIDAGAGERLRGSAHIAAAAENVAASILGASSGGAQNPPGSALGGGGGKGMRDTGNTEYFSQYRHKRASLDGGAAPSSSSSGWSARDRADFESSSSSRSSKRRSMVSPDTKGPTWDEYLKSSGAKSATPGASKRDL